jgi:hypothetical protein
VPTAQSGFLPELRSVTSARKFLRATLTGWGADGWAWSAGQVLTELATNAVVHGRTRFKVDVAFDGVVLRIAVIDYALQGPVEHAYDPEATSGRGLALLTALTHSWGILRSGNSKTVWCELLADPDHHVPPGAAA